MKSICPFLKLAIVIGAMTIFASRSNGQFLTLLTGNEAGGIQLTQSSRMLHHNFRLESTNEAEIKGLQIDLAPMTGPNSIVITQYLFVAGRPASTPGESFVVPSFGSLDMAIQTDLPEPGTYVGSVSFIYDRKRLTRAVKVLRERRNTGVEVSSVSTAVADGNLGWLGIDANLRFVISETNGQAITLTPPEIIGLALVQAGKAGKAQWQAPADVTISALNRAATNPWLVAAGETVHVEARVRNLSRAGEYTGILRVRGRETAIIDTPFTILARESAVLAGAIIFFGALLSYLLRTYFKSGRPKILRQQRLATVRDHLRLVSSGQHPLTDQEQNVVTRLFRRMQALADELEAGSAANPDDILTALEAQVALVPEWIQANQRVESLEPAKLRSGPRALLAEVKKALLNNSPATDDLEAARTQLGKIEEEIQSSLKAELESQIAGLMALVEHPPAGQIGPETRRRISSDVAGPIGEAKRAIAENNLEAAAKTIEFARARMARILADVLQASLGETPPPGFTAERWALFKEQLVISAREVRASNNSAAAITAYESTFELYLAEVCRGLESHIRKTVQKVMAEGSWSEEQKAAKIQELQALSEKLTQAVTEVRSGQLAEAARGFEVVKAALTDLADSSEGKIMGAEATKAISTLISPWALPPVNTGGLPAPKMNWSLTDLKDPRQILRRLHTADLIVLFIVQLLAVASGLFLLWSDNPVWGGFKDYLTTFLWGLGLHQLAGQSTDASGISEKFSK